MTCVSQILTSPDTTLLNTVEPVNSKSQGKENSSNQRGSNVLQLAFFHVLPRPKIRMPQNDSTAELEHYRRNAPILKEVKEMISFENISSLDDRSCDSCHLFNTCCDMMSIAIVCFDQIQDHKSKLINLNSIIVDNISLRVTCRLQICLEFQIIIYINYYTFWI